MGIKEYTAVKLTESEWLKSYIFLSKRIQLIKLPLIYGNLNRMIVLWKYHSRPIKFMLSLHMLS